MIVSTRPDRFSRLILTETFGFLRIKAFAFAMRSALFSGGMMESRMPHPLSERELPRPLILSTTPLAISLVGVLIGLDNQMRWTF